MTDAEAECNGVVPAVPLTLESPDWDDASPDDQLASILALSSPPDWFDPRILHTLSGFRPIYWQWARIKAYADQRGVKVRDLQQAVDQFRWLERPVRDDADQPPQDWTAGFLRSKTGDPQETLGNCQLALSQMDPWASGCWYDEVRDICMVEDREIDDLVTTEAKLHVERLCGIPMRSRHLVPTALTYLCHQRPRDLLREWLLSLPAWDGVPRLGEWLHDIAHAPKTLYGMDVARVLIVSLVARALNPGCQYRYVVIFEGPQNTGKSKLAEFLVASEWHREISHGLDGKEAHMRIRRAWVAELAELASFSKTEDARLKTFFTMKEDVYIPKYANFEVRHKRRTIFIGTHNPSGDNTYLRDQTGNTRYLPIPIHDVRIDDLLRIREQLFAEALVYYQGHPGDWWDMSPAGEAEAQEEREERRQQGVYEENLQQWLQVKGYTVVYWDLLATEYLELPKERWADRRIQMEITRALYALGWRKGKRERLAGVGLIVPWRR
jgi:Virulence-associated protein E